MPIVLACPCGKRLQVADANGGKLVACPACKAHIRVPLPATDVMTSPPRPAVPPPLPPEADPPEVEMVETRNFGPSRGIPDYFQKPPPKIGDIRSAHTSLTQDMQHWTMWGRLRLASLIAFVAIVFLFAGVWVAELNRWAPPARMGDRIAITLFAGTLFFLLVLGIIAVATQFNHYCGYVGVHGLAYYECKGSRQKVTKKQSLVFDEAADLRTKLVHTFVNGVYQSTAYEFHWTDEDDGALLSIKGTHTSHDNMPHEQSSYVFATFAEQEWSIYLLAKVLAKLHAGGSYTFYLTNGGTLKLREDSLRLRIGSDEQEFYPEDIAEMKIEQGVIQLKEPGARKGWFTSTGIHSFNFADLSNARVFLLLVEDLFDVPIN